MQAITLIALGVTMIAGALLILLPAARRRRQQRPFPGPLPGSLPPDPGRRRLPRVAVARSGNVTAFGVGLGVALLISAGLAAVFWVPHLLVPSLGISRTVHRGPLTCSDGAHSLHHLVMPWIERQLHRRS
jgi:hypothetical protein